MYASSDLVSVTTGDSGRFGRPEVDARGGLRLGDWRGECLVLEWCSCLDLLRSLEGVRCLVGERPREGSLLLLAGVGSLACREECLEEDLRFE
jgi:hypothetical protein